MLGPVDTIGHARSIGLLRRHPFGGFGQGAGQTRQCWHCHVPGMRQWGQWGLNMIAYQWFQIRMILHLCMDPIQPIFGDIAAQFGPIQHPYTAMKNGRGQPTGRKRMFQQSKQAARCKISRHRIRQQRQKNTHRLAR